MWFEDYTFTNGYKDNCHTQKKNIPKTIITFSHDEMKPYKPQTTYNIEWETKKRNIERKPWKKKEWDMSQWCLQSEIATPLSN